MKRKCIVLLILVVLLFVGCSEGAEETEGNEDLSYDGASQGLLYEGTIEGSKVHIYGGMNVLTEEQYPLAEGVVEAFDQAEVYAETVNTILFSDEELQERSDTIAVYTPGEGSMDEDLSEEVFDQMSEISVENGMSWQVLSQYKPWVGRNFLLSVSYADVPLSYAQGTSNYFNQRADESDMEALSLYTIEEMIERDNEHYNQIPIESQEQMIKETLEEIEAGFAQEMELIHAWEQGDMNMPEEVLEARITHEDSGVREYYQREYKTQNQEIAKRLEELILEGEEESYFFQISVMNMLGEESLIEELENLGYEFSRVEL